MHLAGFFSKSLIDKVSKPTLFFFFLICSLSADPWKDAEKAFYDGDLEKSYQILLPLAQKGEQDARIFSSLFLILTDDLDDLNQLEGETPGFDLLLQGRWIEFEGDLDGAIELYEKAANLKLKQAIQKLAMLRKPTENLELAQKSNGGPNTRKKKFKIPKFLSKIFKRSPKSINEPLSEGEVKEGTNLSSENQKGESSEKPSELPKVIDASELNTETSSEENDSTNSTNETAAETQIASKRSLIPEGLRRLFKSGTKSKDAAKIWAKAEKEFYDGNLPQAYQILLPLAQEGDQDAQAFSSLYHLLLDDLDDLDELSQNSVGLDDLLKGRWREFSGDLDGAIALYQKAANLNLKQAQQKLDMLRKPASDSDQLFPNTVATSSGKTKRSSFVGGLANLFGRKSKPNTDHNPKESNHENSATKANPSVADGEEERSKQALSESFQTGDADKASSPDMTITNSASFDSETENRRQKKRRGFFGLFGSKSKPKPKAHAELWNKAEKEFYDGDLPQAYKTLLPLANQGDSDAQTFASLYHILKDRLDDLDELDSETLGFDLLLKGRWIEFKGDIDGAIALYEKAAKLGLKQAQQKLDMLKKKSDPYHSIADFDPSKLNLTDPPVDDRDIHGLRLGMHRLEVLHLMKKKGISMDANKHIELIPYRNDQFLHHDIFFKGSLDEDRTVSEIEVHFIYERAHEILVWYNDLSPKTAMKISDSLREELVEKLQELKLTRSEPRPSIKTPRMNVMAKWRYRKLEKD